MIEINNFNQLIEYFKRPEIKVCHIEKICSEGMVVFFIGTPKKEHAIKLLIEYWGKYGNAKERPLFIDSTL
jgi:hypothetical protein